MLALLLALGAAVTLSTVTQGSARAASCTPYQNSGDPSNEWHIPYGCGGVVIPASHRCAQINTTGATAADECADISAAYTSSGGAIWGEGEFYCQGEYPQCKGMNVQVDMASKKIIPSVPQGIISSDHQAGSYTCNGSACPDGGRAMVSTSHSVKTGTDATYCYDTYAWDPADGDVISVTGASAAFHSTAELDSYHLEVCFGG